MPDLTLSLAMDAFLAESPTDTQKATIRNIIGADAAPTPIEFSSAPTINGASVTIPSYEYTELLLYAGIYETRVSYSTGGVGINDVDPNIDTFIFWDGSQWNLSVGGTTFFSQSDVLTPDLATGWDEYGDPINIEIEAVTPPTPAFIGEKGYLPGSPIRWWISEILQPPIWREIFDVSTADLETLSTTTEEEFQDVQVELAKRVSAVAPDTTPFPSTGLILKDDTGARWRIQVNTSGELTSEFAMNALVSNYLEATGIPISSADKLSTFFNALKPAVLSAFVDGAVLKENLAVINGNTINTLRNRALTLYGSPTLGKCGLLFNGTNQAAKHHFATPIQNRTFICLQHYRQNFQSPITTAAAGYHVFSNYPFNGIAGETLEFEGSSTSARISTVPDAGTTRVAISSPGVTRAFPPRSHFMAYSYNSSVARGTPNAFTFLNEGGTVQTAQAANNAATLTEYPYHQNIQGVIIGGSCETNTGNVQLPSTAPTTRWCANSTGGWLMFNRILTESEITQVFTAARVLFPKWKYVTAGDSIINFTLPVFMTLPDIWGTNVVTINYAVGGTQTPSIVAGLGTTGITSAGLASTSDEPVVFDFFSSDHFYTGYTAAQQYADFKTIWQFVRTNNSDATIIARTYTLGRPGGTYTEEQHALDMAGQLAFNALMRDDQDKGFYDILVDSYELAETLNQGSGYAHHGLNPAIIQDTVHPTTALSTAVGLKIIESLEANEISIR